MMDLAPSGTITMAENVKNLDLDDTVDSTKEASEEQEESNLDKSQWIVEPIEEKYILGEEMGQGSFGLVRKVHLRDDTNCQQWTKKLHSLIQPTKYYGCKTIPKSKVEGDISILKEEVSNLYLVKNHPRLLQIQQVYEDTENIHIITELLTGGELYSKVREMQNNGRYFSNEDAAFMIRNILDGISYMHSLGIVHRDLKVSNFMFAHSSHGKHIRNIKIIDFGLSKKIVDGLVSGCCGNAYYVAPEVLLEESYTSKVDVWSIGVIAYLILSLTLPFMGEDERATVNMLQHIEEHMPKYDSRRWKRLQEVEPEAVDFCKTLMQGVEGRPTAREAINHPWIVKHCGVSGELAKLDDDHPSSYMQKVSFWLFNY